METPQTLTELEDRLAARGGAALRDQLVARLRELEERLGRRIAGMVPREEYQSIAAAKEAARVAQLVLQDWTPETKASLGDGRAVAGVRPPIV